MHDLISSISDREIASAFWLSVLAAFVLKNAEARNAFGKVLRAFFVPALLTPLCIGAVYAAGEIILLKQIGWWSIANLKTTVLWVVTFAFVGMFEVASIKNRNSGIKEITRDIFSAATLLTFIAELYSFPLLVELVALPIATTIVLMAEIAKHRPEHAITVKPLGCLAALIGLGYFCFSLWMTFAEWQKTATWANALEFLVPILLSVGFLPFLYMWRAYVAYSNTFAAVSVVGIDAKLVPYARWLAFTRIRSDLELLDRWRRSIQTSRPANKTELKDSLTALRALRDREASPPVIQPRDGWSPYLAMRFMADYGFETGYYHHSFDDEWFASSPMREISEDSIFPNNVAYYVEGNENAATLLKIKLNVNDLPAARQSEDLFTIHCLHLLEQAVSLDAVERMKDYMAALSPFKEEIPFGSVTLSRADFTGGIRGGYSRTFEIRRGQ